jgi:hypothetical protein
VDSGAAKADTESTSSEDGDGDNMPF